MKGTGSLISWAALSRSRRLFVLVLSRIWRLMPSPVRYLTIWLLSPKVVIGVSGVILNDAQQVLLLRHRFHPEHPWGLPGGLLHRGENLIDGWRREVWEETRLDIRVDSIVDQRSLWATQEFILSGHLEGGEIKLDPVEILEARFFESDALPHGIRRHHRLAIRRVVENESDLLPIYNQS